MSESAALEAFFRYLFAHNASGKQKRASAYCLFLREQNSDVLNPDAAFLARFSDIERPVRTGSRFREGFDLRFDAAIVKKKSDTFFQIQGGYYEGFLSGSIGLYDVRLEGKAWHVELTPGTLILITEKKKPNKAPEPTSRPVTIPAEPGIAPGRAVAHL